MNVELTSIAESKVRQLGGDVCGVLVRTEAGAWAAVSEGGRVMWLYDFEGRADETRAAVMPSEHGKNRYGLDMAYFRELFNRELNRPLVDFRPDELARVLARAARTADAAVLQEPEFQAARAQSEQGAEPEGFDFDGWYDKHQSLFRDGVGKSDLRAAYKQGYRDSQPAQQGSVPDVARLVGKLRTLIAAGNRLNAEAQECTYDDGAAEVASVDFWGEFRDALEAATEALAAQKGSVPEGDGWVKCGERLPTEADADSEGNVWFCWPDGDMRLVHYKKIQLPYHSEHHWKPTGLKRPQPPKEGE